MLINVFPQTGSISLCHLASDYDPSSCIYALTWTTGSFALVSPIVSTLMFVFAYHFWFQEFLIGLYLDIMNIGLENSSAEAGLPSHVCRTLYHRSRNDFNELVQGFVQFQNTSKFLKFVYPFQSPAAIIFNFVFVLTFIPYQVLYPIMLQLGTNGPGSLNVGFAYIVGSSWYGASNLYYYLLFCLFIFAFVIICSEVVIAGLAITIIMLSCPFSGPLILWLYNKYGDRVHCCCHIDSVP